MKILVISDVVEPRLYRQFDPKLAAGVDLIISCGDLPPEYLVFLRGRLEVPLFYVRGNHDIRYRHGALTGCMDINNRLVTAAGLTFLGLEGSRWYNGRPAQYTEARMRRRIRRLYFPLWRRGGVDIVVTHAPPRHIHDAEDLCHRGFRSFHPLIHRWTPSWFLHGHIHRQFETPEDRVSEIGDTRVVNACGYVFLEVEKDETLSGLSH